MWDVTFTFTFTPSPSFTVIDTLGMNGAVSVVGRLAGPVPQFNTATLFFRRLRIGGVAVDSWSPQQMPAQWSQVVDLLNKCHRRPVIDHIYPFPDLLTLQRNSA